MNEFEQIVIEEGEEFLRLDQILSQRYKGQFSRTYFQKLISNECVLLNGKTVKKRIRPSVGDEVEIEFTLDEELDIKPESIPLDILYEDEDIIVVNKAPGLVVHPAPGNWTGTFVNALLNHCLLAFQEKSLRPGIVHRLDKDTSGVLIAAKNPEAQRRLIASFSAREVVKEYLVIAVGTPKKLIIDAPIGRSPWNRQKMAVVSTGKNARSYLEVLKNIKDLSFIKVLLETGRTHQIRVHLNSIGTPVLGDSLYGNIGENEKHKALRQLLHAWRLKIKHPITKQEMVFEAPIPADFTPFLE